MGLRFQTATVQDRSACRCVEIAAHFLHAGGLGVAGSVDNRVSVNVAPLLLLMLLLLLLLLLLMLMLLMLLLLLLLMVVQRVRRCDGRDVVGHWPVVVPMV